MKETLPHIVPLLKQSPEVIVRRAPMLRLVYDVIEELKRQRLQQTTAFSISQHVIAERVFDAALKHEATDD